MGETYGLIYWGHDGICRWAGKNGQWISLDTDDFDDVVAIVPDIWIFDSYMDALRFNKLRMDGLGKPCALPDLPEGTMSIDFDIGTIGMLANVDSNRNIFIP